MAAAYRMLWRAALPGLRLMAALGAIPRNLKVTERTDPGPRAGEGERPLWMHCASLGEAKGLWVLADSLPPGLPLLLTASTAAGAAYLRDRCAGAGLPRRRARIAPLDHPELIEAFLDRGRIRGLCLYELELWPSALAACAARGLPVALASGRLSERAWRRYGAWGTWMLRRLDGFAWILAQSEADAGRFSAASSAPVRVGADLKTLAFPPARAGAGGPRSRFGFLSLHYRELRLLLPILPALQARGGILVFPRHPREFAAFRKALSPLGFVSGRADADAPFVLVDALGRVADLLPLCHTVFVGGSLFPPGCHNLWEPLAAGARIVIGPHYRSQAPVAEALLARGLAVVAAKPRDLAALPPLSPDAAAAGSAFAASARSAAERALRACREGIISTFSLHAPDLPTAEVAAGGEGIKR